MIKQLYSHCKEKNNHLCLACGNVQKFWNSLKTWLHVNISITLIWKNVIFKKYFFLTRELSLINTCCWRADHEILMHDGEADNTCVNKR